MVPNCLGLELLGVNVDAFAYSKAWSIRQPLTDVEELL